MNPSDTPDIHSMYTIPRFMLALNYNDVEEASLLLDSGVDVDTKLNTGYNSKPALCYCIEERNMQVAQLLIERGCSVNLATGSGDTPLHLAISKDLHELVIPLLRNRANVNARNRELQTPLHVACAEASYETYLAILDAGADIHVVDFDQRTTLIHACIKGNIRIALSLIEKGVNVNHHDFLRNTALTYAITVDPCLNLVKALIQHGAEVNPPINAYSDLPLLSFLRSLPQTSPLDISEAADILRVLIDAGCKLNVRTAGGLTPLHLAINTEIPALVKILLNSGCVYSTDNLGKTPLYYACYNNNSNIVRMLIAGGIRWDFEIWLRCDILRSSCNPDLVTFCIEQRKKLPTLLELSRTVIRRLFAPDLERSVDALPCPPVLKEFVKLEYY